MSATTRPRLSGYCNPTLPRTGRYDPHRECRLEGCTCTCHTPTPRPRVPLACLQRRCDHDHEETR